MSNSLELKILGDSSQLRREMQILRVNLIGQSARLKDLMTITPRMNVSPYYEQLNGMLEGARGTAKGIESIFNRAAAKSSVVEAIRPTAPFMEERRFIMPDASKIKDAIEQINDWFDENKAVKVAGDNYQDLIDIIKQYRPNSDALVKDLREEKAAWEAVDAVIKGTIQGYGKRGATLKEITHELKSALSFLKIDFNVADYYPELLYKKVKERGGKPRKTTGAGASSTATSGATAAVDSAKEISAALDRQAAILKIGLERLEGLWKVSFEQILTYQKQFYAELREDTQKSINETLKMSKIIAQAQASVRVEAEKTAQARISAQARIEAENARVQAKTVDSASREATARINAQARVEAATLNSQAKITAAMLKAQAMRDRSAHVSAQNQESYAKWFSRVWRSALAGQAKGIRTLRAEWYYWTIAFHWAARGLRGLKARIDEVVDTGRQFEKQMSAMGAAAQFSGHQTSRMTRFIRNLAMDMPQTATELSTAATELAKMGDTALGIRQKLKTVVQLAMDAKSAEAAASTLNSTLTSFSLRAGDAAKVGDIMAMAIDDSRLAFEDFDLGLRGLKGIQAITQIQFQEMTAAMMLLRDAGIPANVAMTAVRSGFDRLNRQLPPVQRGLKGLGIELTDVMPKTNDFNSIIGEFADANATAAHQQKNLSDIFGRWSGTIGLLIERYPQLIAQTDALENSSGRLERRYKALTDNLYTDERLRASALEELQLRLYDQMYQSLRRMTQAQRDLYLLLAANTGLQESVAKGYRDIADAVTFVTRSIEDDQDAVRALASGFEWLGSAGGLVIKVLGGVGITAAYAFQSAQQLSIELNRIISNLVKTPFILINAFNSAVGQGQGFFSAIGRQFTELNDFFDDAQATTFSYDVDYSVDKEKIRNDLAGLRAEFEALLTGNETPLEIDQKWLKFLQDKINLGKLDAQTMAFARLEVAKLTESIEEGTEALQNQKKAMDAWEKFQKQIFEKRANPFERLDADLRDMRGKIREAFTGDPDGLRLALKKLSTIAEDELRTLRDKMLSSSDLTEMYFPYLDLTQAFQNNFRTIRALRAQYLDEEAEFIRKKKQADFDLLMSETSILSGTFDFTPKASVLFPDAELAQYRQSFERHWMEMGNTVGIYSRIMASSFDTFFGSINSWADVTKLRMKDLFTTIKTEFFRMLAGMAARAMAYGFIFKLLGFSAPVGGFRGFLGLGGDTPALTPSGSAIPAPIVSVPSIGRVQGVTGAGGLRELEAKVDNLIMETRRNTMAIQAADSNNVKGMWETKPVVKLNSRDMLVELEGEINNRYNTQGNKLRTTNRFGGLK